MERGGWEEGCPYEVTMKKVGERTSTWKRKLGTSLTRSWYSKSEKSLEEEFMYLNSVCIVTLQLCSVGFSFKKK